jgi:GNAT superfamily N-acetyltransferase
MTINIRDALQTDLPLLQNMALEMGAHHEADYFERCLREQTADSRRIFLALAAAAPVGYVQLNWYPLYQPFRRLGIPEIQDLNVIPAYRRKGIGALLVERCEMVARQSGKTDIGISVGLYASYGPAQRLYVQRGYVPDGAGITADDVPVRGGEMRPVDDNLTLKLVKSFS